MNNKIQNSRNVFLTNGNEFDMRSSNLKTVWPLDVAVYMMCWEKNRGIFLKYYKEEFDFNFQRYPIDEDFVQHIIRRYPMMTKSMGILLNGKKGAGKSVIAKTIANELKLPVIIIQEAFEGLTEFMASITFPCVFFLDEFEKNFNDDDDNQAGTKLLSLMDGVYTGCVPHVFILTTNSLRINDNLISRPGRILYSRSYDCLDVKVIKSFIDDNLERTEFKEEILEELASLKDITIDIVKAIVDEVNLMGISPRKACEYLNVDKVSLSFDAIFREVIPSEESEYDIEDFKRDSERLVEHRKKERSGLLTPEEENIEFYPLMSTYVHENVKVTSLKPRDKFSDMIVIKVYEGGKYVKFLDSYNRTRYYYFSNPSGNSFNFVL